jgi:hypothetical protein
MVSEPETTRRAAKATRYSVISMKSRFCKTRDPNKCVHLGPASCDRDFMSVIVRTSPGLPQKRVGRGAGKDPARPCVLIFIVLLPCPSTTSKPHTLTSERRLVCCTVST